MQTLEFIGYLVANTLLIWITSSLVPSDVVLGNQHLTPLWASVLSGFVLATVMVLTKPTIELTRTSLKGQSLTVVTLMVNTLAVWLVTRAALVVGLGIAAFWWAGVIGILLTLGQWLVGSIVIPSKKG